MIVILVECLKLFYAFFKIGIVGFGGGYAMISMIMAESERFSVSMEQFADLNALDMVIPGPIAINAATYVGYLHAGVWGAIAATIGIMAPGFFIVWMVMHFISRYRQNHIMNSVLGGVKPAAVGLIAAASMMIAGRVLLYAGKVPADLLKDPLGTISLFLVAVFMLTAFLNIRLKINPILLTAAAGVAGAIWYSIF